MNPGVDREELDLANLVGYDKNLVLKDALKSNIRKISGTYKGT